MLAFAWRWGSSEPDDDQMSARLASSLCAGIGGAAGTGTYGALHFAYRQLSSTQADARAWKPTVLPSGRVVLLHGYLDNGEAVAEQLQVQHRDHSLLYGMAVERWGDDADRRLIGDYCAIIVCPDAYRVRLSRSPLRAPPLCYFSNDELTAVASVPRALFAAGVDR
jgi:asparagine synthase (glutamine-hydrolysing)